MTKINLKSKLKANSKVVSKELNGNVYLLDSIKGEVHILNETASYIWQKTKVGVSFGEIVESLANDYDTDRNIAEKDARELIEKYLDLGFLKVINKT